MSSTPSPIHPRLESQNNPATARVAAQTTLADWLHLIRAEYLEIPGLHLTKKQAERLWGLDSITCDAVLDALVDVKFLRRTPHGGYARADLAS